MRFSSFTYLVGQGLHNLKANKMMTLASMGVLIVCMILVGAAFLFGANIDSMVAYIGEQNETVAFINDDADTAAVEEAIRSIPHVAGVEFISKDQMLDEYSQRLEGYTNLKEMFQNDNPLLANYVVRADDPANISSVAAALQNVDGVRAVNSPQAMSDLFVSLQKAVTYVCYGLVIVLAIIMDITAQMNIWSVVSVSGMRAQDVANKLLPGLGVVIAILVAIGGLAFNVGNVGGVALGFNAMFGLNEKIGAVIAGCLGIIIFVNKNAKTIMDKVATVLAAVILLTVATVAVISKPPVGEAVSSLAQLGNAAALLIIAGAFNGLILPVTLGVMLIAGHNKRIVGESYHHPLWMTVLGAVVTLVALYAGIKAVPGIMQLFQ